MSSSFVDEIEHRRLELQASLDAAKTREERNRLGQFATPAKLATDILKYAQSIIPADSSVRFLDPAIGSGSFYSALLRTFPHSQISAALGYEVDPHYGNDSIRLWQDTPLKYNLADFTRSIPPVANDDKATLLICNPPYVRHHHLPADEKLRMQGIIQRTLGIQVSGLAGLYCYFLCLSHQWMTDQGIGGWLVPSEFMDVNYGRQIKSYLLDRVTLLRIHRYRPEDAQFTDAIVSSAVIWFKNAAPPPNHTVEVTYGGTLLDPQISKIVSVDVLRNTRKWTNVPLVADDYEINDKNLTLSDLFEIKRGLATGANDFFILTEEQVSDLRLPGAFLVPILPSPRYLRSDEVSTDDIGNPITEPKLFLLSCSLPENQVQIEYPLLWNYLRKGYESGLSTRYLCTHRSPWYSQELRSPSPILCTYMGRSGSSSSNGGRPFRFILNHSKAIAANVYLMLYPRPRLARMIGTDETRLRAVWQALNEIPIEELIGEGRTYGGGLHKLEPRELANAPVERVLAVVPELRDERSTQLALF